jgi:hypothetical protein
MLLLACAPRKVDSGSTLRRDATIGGGPESLVSLCPNCCFILSLYACAPACIDARLYSGKLHQKISLNFGI